MVEVSVVVDVDDAWVERGAREIAGARRAAVRTNTCPVFHRDHGTAAAGPALRGRTRRTRCAVEPLARLGDLGSVRRDPRPLLRTQSCPDPEASGVDRARARARATASVSARTGDVGYGHHQRPLHGAPRRRVPCRRRGRPARPSLQQPWCSWWTRATRRRRRWRAPSVGRTERCDDTRRATPTGGWRRWRRARGGARAGVAFRPRGVASSSA